MVRRIHVHYVLRMEGPPDEGTRDKIDRAVARHPRKCPVARTLEGCVAVTTDLEVAT